MVPPPRMRLSEWIERELVLPSDVAALAGKVRLYPFQREIADAIGDPAIERVTLVKPVRVGFTTLLTGAMAGFCANDPAPILSLLPTESDCRDYMVSDVEPIFAVSPSISNLLSGDLDEAGRNTLVSRRFPGGSLKVVAAKAPRNLRRHNVRVLFIDEADAMESTADGSPVILAEDRTISFPDRKIVMGSTPRFSDTSHVLAAYAKSDQRVYEVLCAECKEFHEILWKDIHWPDDEPEKAAWCCPGCGVEIAEKFKASMVAAGRWRALAPEVKGHAGFKLNALISPLSNVAWGALAARFVRDKNDPATLQPFVNTVLAEGWREEGEELDELELSTRAEPFSLVVNGESGTTGIPELVMVITAGVECSARIGLR